MRVFAPAQGVRVLELLVEQGDYVKKGQALAVMEAMEMEHTIAAPADGTVADWMLRAFRKEDNDAVRLATIYAVGQIPEAGYAASIEVWGITATTLLMTFFSHRFNWRSVTVISLLIMAATNEALRSANELASKKMGGITSGLNLNIPGLPF